MPRNIVVRLRHGRFDELTHDIVKAACRLSVVVQPKVYLGHTRPRAVGKSSENCRERVAAMNRVNE